MFERFTQEARDALTRAREEAASLGHDFVGTEHLLLGVAAGDDGILASLGADHPALRRAVAEMYPVGPDADALASIGIDLDAVRRSIEESFGTGALFARRGRRARNVSFCPRAKRALERALREALALRQRHIGREHLLLALAGDGESGAARALMRCGTSPEAVRAATLAALRDAA
jgi:ATP-dependent Clp protease ATP-binding subunit ClpA